MSRRSGWWMHMCAGGCGTWISSDERLCLRCAVSEPEREKVRAERAVEEEKQRQRRRES